MWLAVTIMLGAAAVGAGLVLWRRRRNLADWFLHVDDAAAADAPVAVPEPSVRGSAQILFTESRGRRLHVDCVVVGGHPEPQGARRGSLLGFTVAVPSAVPLARSIVGVVDGWADDCRVVDLELTRALKGWRAQFDDGDTKVNLDLSQLLTAEAGLDGPDGER